MPFPKRGKVDNIRYIEYYDLQETFDRLYKQSQEGQNFYKLMKIIKSEENIMLALRTIKNNVGSKTAGTDGRNIEHLLKMKREEFIELIQKKLENYKPKSVRRVEIQKSNGKTRPLGIPTIVDRVVQQCVKQVLEPICEAKFYSHSYGFRPDRSAENAMARCNQLIQNSNLHYVIDVDIKGFFENVCHNKLIKQMWHIGIRDKKLNCIIKAMLKAPIRLSNGELKYSEKGTPQGGILSPLLSNIVLNELDWWIASQWEIMPCQNVKETINKNGSVNRGNVYKSFRRKSKLKEMYIVRYADDFKIFCRNDKIAKKVYYATCSWLRERLKLEVNPDKSKIINLHNKYSEFLGFKIKVRKKHIFSKRKGQYKDKWTVISHISDKAKIEAIKKLDKAFKEIIYIKKKNGQPQAIKKYNALVMGLHNYYQIATMVSEDFRDIEWIEWHSRNMRLKRLGATKFPKLKDKSVIKISVTIEKKYGKSKRMWYLNGYPIIPIGYVRLHNAMAKNKAINRYTKEGRQNLHENLKFNIQIMLWLMKNPVIGKSVEYMDNRIAKYSAQKGKCAVTNKDLEIGNIHCHHIKSLKQNGTDKYENLILITKEVHILIHAKNEYTIQKYKEIIKPNDKQIGKINELRKNLDLQEI